MPAAENRSFSLFPRFGPVPMVDTDVMVRAQFVTPRRHNEHYQTLGKSVTQATAQYRLRESRKVENAGSRIDVEQSRARHSD